MKTLNEFKFPDGWPMEVICRGTASGESNTFEFPPREADEIVFGVPGLQSGQMVVFPLVERNHGDIDYDFEDPVPVRPDTVERCLGTRDSSGSWIFHGDEVMVEGERGSYRVEGIHPDGFLALHGCYGQPATSREPEDVTVC